MVWILRQAVRKHKASISTTDDYKVVRVVKLRRLFLQETSSMKITMVAGSQPKMTGISEYLANQVGTTESEEDDCSHKPDMR